MNSAFLEHFHQHGVYHIARRPAHPQAGPIHGWEMPDEGREETQWEQGGKGQRRVSTSPSLSSLYRAVSLRGSQVHLGRRHLQKMFLTEH